MHLIGQTWGQVNPNRAKVRCEVMLQRFAPVVVLLCAPAVSMLAAQPGRRSLKQREVPCQTQYAQAVDTIGMARWSAPEAERPAIERLLNAAAKAKELIDASFLQYDASLCSADTLGRLHASLDRLRSNGWLPPTPEERRDAQAAAVNAELLKAIEAGMEQSASTDGDSAAPRLRHNLSE